MKILMIDNFPFCRFLLCCYTVATFVILYMHRLSWTALTDTFKYQTAARENSNAYGGHFFFSLFAVVVKISFQYVYFTFYLHRNLQNEIYFCGLHCCPVPISSTRKLEIALWKSYVFNNWFIIDNGPLHSYLHIWKFKYWKILCGYCCILIFPFLMN